jgi:pimeloyl-ACP methyl ester carboxylesterase
LVAKTLLAVFCYFVAATAYSQVLDVPHQQDSPTRTFLVAAPNAKALVLLFPGGGGLLKLQDDGQTRNRHTFVRSVDLWAQYQIDAVLVDTPYDLGDLRRGDRRDRADHLARVGEVIEFYKKKFNLPVWIFGHSMGTSTATYFANKVKTNSLAGIIIAGTVRTASLDDDVTFPVLAIHHMNDQCAGTPPSASENIISSRPKNTVSRLEIIEGGASDGNVCDSFAYHGFNQTEPEFIKRAAQFILSQ